MAGERSDKMADFVDRIGEFIAGPRDQRTPADQAFFGSLFDNISGGFRADAARARNKSVLDDPLRLESEQPGGIESAAQEILMSVVPGPLKRKRRRTVNRQVATIARGQTRVQKANLLHELRTPADRRKGNLARRDIIDQILSQERSTQQIQQRDNITRGIITRNNIDINTPTDATIKAFQSGSFTPRRQRIQQLSRRRFGKAVQERLAQNADKTEKELRGLENRITLDTTGTKQEKEIAALIRRLEDRLGRTREIGADLVPGVDEEGLRDILIEAITTTGVDLKQEDSNALFRLLMSVKPASDKPQ